MKDRSPRFVIGILLLLAAVAFITWLVSRAQAAAPAQLPEGVTFDPTTWVASAATLSGVVAVVVQFLKRQFPLKGTATLVVSAGLSLVIAVGIELWQPDVIEGNIFSAVVLAGSAILGSGGIKELLKVAGGGKSTPPPPNVGTLPK